MYNYKLKPQNASSDRLGNCEICGKFVSDVYLQVRYRKTETGEVREGDAFGHKECLMEVRRNKEDDKKAASR